MKKGYNLNMGTCWDMCKTIAESKSVAHKRNATHGRVTNENRERRREVQTKARFFTFVFVAFRFSACREQD